MMPINNSVLFAIIRPALQQPGSDASPRAGATIWIRKASPRPVDAPTSTLVTFARPGQNARYSVTVTAGQLVKVLVTANALDDGNATASNSTLLAVFKPSSPNTNPSEVHRSYERDRYDAQPPAAGDWHARHSN